MDIAVVGAGAVGLSVALHAAREGRSVVVLEKEPAPGRHQSTRNSGVIHAGYNAKPGSQKARFCVEGNRRLREYCEERDVATHPGGILVVARTEAERATLAELKRRADGNGVDARMLDAEGLRAQEPHATGIEALHARDAMSFHPEGYMIALAGDARKAGVELRYGWRVRAIEEGRARTNRGDVAARVVVNAAGLFADRLAARLAPDMRIIPFRGYYAELRAPRRALVRSHLYAAPDLAFPFLGVHLSHRADGRVIVGPGAMVAFGREAYAFAHVHPQQLAWTLAWGGFWRMMARPEFRRFARSELAKSLRLKAIWREARLLVPELCAADLVRAHAGNRAQMVDREGKLVEDIVVRETERNVHVLNAVSPGLTCSLPFGQHVAQLAARKL